MLQQILVVSYPKESYFSSVILEEVLYELLVGDFLSRSIFDIINFLFCFNFFFCNARFILILQIRRTRNCLLWVHDL